MAIKQFKSPADLNVIIKPLQDCIQKKSKNGYYIVSETWGTCFFRVATKRKSFEIMRFKDKSERTYTKIPKSAYKDVYHIYVNVHKYSFFTLNLPAGACIVGMADEQLSGDYMNYSLLVYAPSAAPSVSDIELQEHQFMVKYEKIKKPIKFRIYDLVVTSGYGVAGHIRKIKP